MLGVHCLVIVALVGCSSGSSHLDRTYIEHTATDALQRRMITLSELTHLQCAHQCLLENQVCEGFQLDNASRTCLLYEKICFIRGAPDTYLGMKDHLEPIINTLLARGKPADMSSTAGSQARISNDGVYQGLAFHTSCDDVSSWWRVDLLDSFCVTAVYFLNRGYETDSIWQRANNIVVTVSLLEEDIMDTGDNRCGYIDGVAQQLHNLVTCEIPQVGRFVQLQMLDRNCLHFYEVEVHGH